jgi:antitoxin component YwqK of YwqJK toxin-antitoxin module
LWVEVDYFEGSFDRDGRFQTFTYVNGTRQGPAGQWNADGTARGCHGNYVNDQQDGMWYCYDHEGKPNGWSGKYLNGKRDGLWVEVDYFEGSFDRDGRFQTFTYVNGTRQGPAGQWNADGTARGCHGNFANDKQVGVWTCYKDDGTTYTETYVEGVKQ